MKSETAKSLLTTRSVNLLLGRWCSLEESWQEGERRLIFCSMISSAQVPGQTKQFRLCCFDWLISSQPSPASEAKKWLLKNHLRAQSVLIMTPPSSLSSSPVSTHKSCTCGSEAFLFALDRPLPLPFFSPHTHPLWARMMTFYLSGSEPEPAADSAILMPFCHPPSNAGR